MKTFREVLSQSNLDISGIEEHRISENKRLKQKNITGLIVLLVIAGIGGLISYFAYNGWFLIGGIISGLIAFAIIRGSIKRNLLFEIKEKIIKKLIEAIDSNFEYFPNQSISDETFYDSNFFTSYTTRFGEDLFVGIYKDIYIEFSDLTAKQKVNDTRVIVFNGPFYSFKTNKKFQGRTSIIPDHAEKLLGKFGRVLQSMNFTRDNLIKINDENFEKEFAVFSTNEDEAKKIINSDLINFLMEHKKNSKKVFFSFNEDQVYFGLYNNVNLFRVDINKKITEEVVKTFYNELNSHLNLIEELYNIIQKSQNNL